jgi:hypothetical protein
MIIKTKNAAGNEEILICDECLADDKWTEYETNEDGTSYICECGNTTTYLS